ncbi:MAG: hypothetical protein DBY06_00920 [Clostridiales bacterium]|nr:MAG: hypothetical protein DBY06_00920 [Clostridiales bacterium]
MSSSASYRIVRSTPSAWGSWVSGAALSGAASMGAWLSGASVAGAWLSGAVEADCWEHPEKSAASMSRDRRNAIVFFNLIHHLSYYSL